MIASSNSSFAEGERLKVSIITPSRNHGLFLRETIESVLSQTYKNVEHVVVDGASTDNSVDILKEYPHLKWVSEKEGGDNPCLEAIWKAFRMSTGDYIVFLCVSDGLVDANWLKQAVQVLDNDSEVSLVWGVVQSKTEDGRLGKVWSASYLEHEPPQKKDFLPFWLATREGIECNAVIRRNIFEKCYTRNTKDEPCRVATGLGFTYNFVTQGYLPYFLPVITIFGRVHDDQRGAQMSAEVEAGSNAYNGRVEAYKNELLAGRVKHCFRDSQSEVIGEVTPSDLVIYKKLIWKQRLKDSLNRKFQRLMKRI